MADNKVKFLRGTSDEYTAAEKDNDTIYFTTNDGKLYIGDKKVSGDGGVTIDDTLSDTSTNPVQNKVIKTELDKKADITDIPTSLPANGGNADTVNNHTVKSDVPANAVFTDTIITEKDISSWGFTKNTGTYSKPSNGIPKTDLSTDVQTSLNKADTALQTHQSLADYVKTTDSRLTDARTPTAHNQTSNTINAMTGYSKPSSTSTITTSDSLNTAIGKLEKALDGKQASGSYVTTSDSRLTDARTPKAHTHTKSEVTDFAHTHDDRYYTESEINTKLNTKLNTSLKGAASGLAELDSSGKVPSSQLPSYVDDVLEYNKLASFPSTGETGKIYVATDTNKTYRWSGSGYTEISPSLALGETSSTAYRGDRGKIAYDHSQSTHARTDATKVESSTTNGNIKINGTETKVYTHPSGTNPHGTTKSDIGLGNVGNFKAVSTVASQGLTDTEKSNARANIGAGTSSFSGSYNDLSNKPTIPTVGNGTVTIKQAGVNKGTFTMNQSGNTTIELTDNNTTYGVATTSSLGLIKSGTDITIDSSGNVSVNDDSHNHIISNVDGLQNALNEKAATSHTHTKSQITDFPKSLPANGGNADTINGRRCGRIATFKQDGKYWNANKEDINDAYLQWDGSTYFKLKTFGGNLTAVDYATNADTVDGKHASDFVENMLNSNYHFSMVYGDHNYITNTIDNNVPNLPVVSNYTHIVSRRDSGEVETVLSIGVDYTKNVYVYRKNDGIWKNLSESGNADTVDGKHASDFVQMVDFGSTQTDTKTAVPVQGSMGIFKCGNWTDYPDSFNDGQATLITINYGGSGTLGIDRIWCTQLIITAHYDKICTRYSNGTTVSAWKNIIDGGNADTVDGKHAYQIDTLDVNGNSHTAGGSGDTHNAYIQYDGTRFRLKIVSGYETSVNFADVSRNSLSQHVTATNDNNGSFLRQIASGTAAATTSNCTTGTLYGKYS